MTEPVIAGEVSNLPSLTSLRWYAALMVFLLHAHGRPGFSWRPLNPLGVGYVGVTFFFILSGFVLTWSAPAVVRAGRFYWRRFARIYPLHLACLVLAGIGGLISAKVAHLDGAGGLFTVTLTHAWWPGYRMVETWNGVSWSLSVEAFFYFCFPVILRFLRGRWIFGPIVAIALALGLGLILLLRHQFGIQGAATAYFNPVARLPEFLLGVWLAIQVKDRARRIRLPLWAGLAAVLASGILSWRKMLPLYPLANYVMLPSFALLIMIAAQRDADGGDGQIERFLRHPWSEYLGKISFAFYLVHNLIIAALFEAAGWVHSWSPLAGIAPTAATLLTCVLAAIVLHHAVEVPVRRLLLPTSQRKRTPAKRQEPSRSR